MKISGIDIPAIAITLAMLFAGGSSYAEARVLFPGDCGKPVKGVQSNGAPSASDSLYTLRAAVGSKVCAKYICDVDGNDKVQASDSLLVLRASVGSSSLDDLQCPPCPTTGDAYCACTQSQITAKLDQDPSFTNKPSEDVAAIFSCGDSMKTYSVSAATWSPARRTITASNVWLNARNMTIQSSPLCYATDACPDVDDGSGFMNLAGDNVGVAGFTVRGFFEGIHFQGKNGTVGNMMMDRQCDDSITNDTTAIGSE
ncbi:MAG TPA: hypothetical protein VEL28_03920, partial [Candidatus Binatia bacterium]|nr:hypothetical protein [Candidatus Binatia bacterium]